MGAASFVQTDFRGGEWSLTAQGMLTDPQYKRAMNVSLNALPLEQGAHARRPGSQFAGTTRGGVAGREITFDFEKSKPYKIELTTGYMRFRNGADIVMSNDSIAVSSISSANPASVALTATMPADWATGQTFMLTGLGDGVPTLQNRQLIGTVVDGTHLTIADAITGTSIDGSAIGTFSAGTINRILEVTTPYVGTDWANTRLVQAGITGVMLHGSYAPYSLTVTLLPTETENATFALSPATFVDGPYFDPAPGGSQLTPSGQTGIISLVLAFPAWSATTVYAKGSYVTYSSVNYKSSVDKNLNLQPDTNPSSWTVIQAGEVISPVGFQGSDIGRHIRLFSEPPLWAVGTTYSAGNSVTYVDSQGNTAYWTCLTGNTATAQNAPGLNATNWGINASGATWTWGTITELLNQVVPNPVGSSNIGNMSGGGGLAAAFDGNTSQDYIASANFSNTVTGLGPTQVALFDGYVGKDFGSGNEKQIQSVTVYPSTDGIGIVNTTTTILVSVLVELYGSNTLPTGPTDGTALGAFSTAYQSTYILNTGPVSIASSDETTAFRYVWTRARLQVYIVTGSGVSVAAFVPISEVQFFTPSGASSSGVKVELIGGNLQYGNAIRTWRLGLFSNTTGWPKCGTYHQGRLWLSGAVANRFDSSVPVTVAPDGTIKSFTFSPTKPDGTVTDASAISYTLDAKDVNTIFWMEPDAQGIILGTQAAEWLVQASANNNVLTPTSIQAHRVTRNGCANIEPRRTEHTLVFVQKHLRSIIEYFADVFSGKFTAPDLAEKAKHATTSGISELAYQQEISPVLWARRADGTLIGLTYKRDTLMTSQGPTFSGMHRHTLGSGRIVESVCVGPSVGGMLDSLSLVTNDTVTNIRHVEVLTDIWEEGNELTDAWFLDDAVEATSYTTAVGTGGAPGITINGLWHLNGKTVSVFCGGLDVGDYVVSSGSVFVPFSPSSGQTNTLFTSAFVTAFDDAMPIVAGFCYTSQGQLLRPDTQPEGGARNGPGFGKNRRMHKFAALLVDTQDIYFGTSFSNLRPALFKSAGGNAYAANVLFNGIYKDVVPDDGEGFASQLCWQSSRMFPATLAAIGGFLQTQDE